MKRPHLLIVGCGDIGRRVAPLLLEQGWIVSGLSRSPDRLPEVLSHRVAGDYTNPDSLEEARDLSADYVLFTPTPSSYDLAGYETGYAQGARVVASKLVPRIRRLIAVSSTRVYAERQGGWVDEESALADTDPYVGALVSAENELRRAVTTTVIRPSGLYDGANPVWLRHVMAGQISVPASHFSNRIHRDDLASVIAQLLDMADKGIQIPPTLNVNDDEPATVKAVETWCLDALGISASSERSGSERANRRVSNQRLRALGITLKYPSFREGYAAAIEAAKAL